MGQRLPALTIENMAWCKAVENPDEYDQDLLDELRGMFFEAKEPPAEWLSFRHYNRHVLR